MLSKAKQHPELLLLKNYSLSSFTLLSKNDRTFSKEPTKKTSMSVLMRSYD